MCTLNIFFKVFDGLPVLLLANRDELIDRPWDPPGYLSTTPGIFGPKDRAAGGTWMGVNEAGLLAGLANHEGTLSTGGSLCSRGYLVMETLRHPDAFEARRFAETIAPVCKAYTLLVADGDKAFVVDHLADDTVTYELKPGPHVITNARFRDPNDPKAQRTLERMEKLIEAGTPDPETMAEFLSDHESAPGQPFPLCVHPEPGGKFATTSATAIALGKNEVKGYWFARGAPCENPLEPVTPDFSNAAS